MGIGVGDVRIKKRFVEKKQVSSVERNCERESRNEGGG
jgi:hypothetical protein